MSGRTDHPNQALCPLTALLAVVGVLGACAAPATAAEAPGTPPEASSVKPKLVSNLWVEAELREVLQDIAAQTGTTIIADQTVQGIVSMAAKDLSLEECLRRLCASGGYEFVRVDDYYIFGLAAPGTPLFHRLAQLHRVKLRHLSAKQVKTLLPQSLATCVTYDEVNGVVVVMGPEAVRQRVLDAIRLIDVPQGQVAVEAVVFELSEAGAKQLGLDWQYQNRGLLAGTQNLIGTITYDEASDAGIYVDLMLRAIVQDQKGQILANPRIITMNGQEAQIFVGQEKYFSLLSGHAAYPYYRLESIESGVTLKVTPHIGADGCIVLDLEPEVSDVVQDWTRDGTENGNENQLEALPVVTRRKAKTTITIQDGQTVIIGGLLQEHRREMTEKIPLLGDLPLLGPIFQNVQKSVEQKEIVLVITTHLVHDETEARSWNLPTGLQQRYVSPLDLMAEPANGDTP